MSGRGGGTTSFIVRVAGYLALVLAITAVVSVPIGAALDALSRERPDLLRALWIPVWDGGWSFGRVFRRVGLAVALVVGWALRRHLPRAVPRGFGPDDRPWRRLASGFALGVATFAIMVLVLTAAGELRVQVVRGWSWPIRIAEAMATGLVVGAIEESLLRGWLQQALQRLVGVGAAVVAIAVPYSVLHYFRAPVDVTAAPGLGLGVRAIVEHASAMFDPAIAAPALGLVLVGIVLGLAYADSGSLPFAIGLHAGWVAVIKLGQGVFGPAMHMRGLWGPGGLLGSEWAWLALLLMIPTVRLWLGRIRLSFPRPREGEPT